MRYAYLTGVVKPLFLLCFVTLFSGWIPPKGVPVPERADPDQSDTGLVAWYWGFDRWNDREGWSVSDALTGSVTGGALWLSIQGGRNLWTDTTWMTQIYAPNLRYELESPRGLGVSADRYNQVVIRLLNLSPETDGFVRWQTAEKQGINAGSVRFTMKPDCREWQEVVCFMDHHWKGTVDQIRIQPARMWQRGDIWIDRIKITRGKTRPVIPKPDLSGSDVVPTVRLPGISQEDFRDAFRVLEECVITDVPLNGFNYPTLSPGGHYGQNWWQLDASLCVAGVKWMDQRFVENIMRGFAEVQDQNPDGRIDLWGGSPYRGQVGDVSSLPRFFEAAFDVARRSQSRSIQDTIYQSMKKYLVYWLSAKKTDPATGLVTAAFEETFSNPHRNPGIIAPVDLNVAVAVGCNHTGRLAEYLGKKSEAALFFEAFERIRDAINGFNWNPDSQVYYNYNAREKKQDKRLLCTTFDPLRLGIASPDQVKKLIPCLLDTSLFYWGIRPLTTVARTEPGYLEAIGVYDGKAWFGDVWTMRNLFIVKGLEDAGRHDLAAELAWSTIKNFNARYFEYLAPSTGSGEGVARYGWTASQYIQAIIEHVFGIDYDDMEKRLRIVPHVPDELVGQEIEIGNLKIPGPTGLRIDVKVCKRKDGATIVACTMHGELPEDSLEIGIPHSGENKVTVGKPKGKYLSAAGFEGMANVLGIQMKMKNKIEVTFK